MDPILYNLNNNHYHQAQYPAYMYTMGSFKKFWVVSKGFLVSKTDFTWNPSFIRTPVVKFLFALFR